MRVARGKITCPVAPGLALSGKTIRMKYSRCTHCLRIADLLRNVRPHPIQYTDNRGDGAEICFFPDSLEGWMVNSARVVGSTLSQRVLASPA